MLGETKVTRVERTFGFVDISRFTTYTDRRGDELAVQALSEFRHVVRDVASRHGTRVDKWLGDGAMFVSIETAALVEAILAIEARLLDDGFPLPLRAGLASGFVILFEGDDYIGTPVNLASRLCAEAEPGQTLVTEPVALCLPDWVDRSPVGMIDIRGLAEPVAVVAVTASRAPLPSDR